MKFIWWILSIIGGIIVFVIIMKIVTRDKEDSNYSENSLLNRARGGIGKLADCCKKLVGR